MGLGAKREIYSGYEPSWIFAHTAPYWIQELQDEKILPTAKELLMNGGVDENFCYVSEEEISDLFTWLVPQAMMNSRNGTPKAMTIWTGMYTMNAAI